MNKEKIMWLDLLYICMTQGVEQHAVFRCIPDKKCV